MHEEKTLILSSALFPPICWFALLLNHKNCIIETKETYAKQTYRNRFTILSADNKIDLNISVNKTYGNHTTINQAIAIIDRNLIRNHLTTIESAYKTSPYYDYFIDFIKEFYSKEYSNLLEMNLESVNTIGKILKFKFNYLESIEFQKEYNKELYTDLRFDISPKNLELNNFNYPPYYQNFINKFGFISNLSILDLVFNLGLESIYYLKKFPVNEFQNHITKE